MFTGVILAGGENRRMNGKMKALLSLDGEIIIQRQIREMKLVCQELIVVTNKQEFFTTIENIDRVVTDIIPGRGPLSGMHAAFSLANYTDIWVVACDMPFVSHKAAQILRAQREQLDCDAVIPFIQDKLQPLHGVYRKSVVPEIEKTLATKEYKVGLFLDRIEWHRITADYFITNGIDLSFVTNVNTPTEYQSLLNRRGSSNHG